MRVGIFSVAPSPYQRDLFASLAQLEEISLSVFYWERFTPDSPWKIDSVFEHESFLDSRVFSILGKRIHWSRDLPDPSNFEVIIFNGYMNLAYRSYISKIPSKTRTIWFGERFASTRFGLIELLYRYFRSPIMGVDGVIAIGAEAQEQYRTLFPGRPSINQPYAIATEGPKSKGPEGTSDRVNLLFCGQLIRRKGFDLLLEAFKKLLEDESLGGDIELTVVGAGELEYLLEEVSDNARSRIHHMGFLQPGELSGIFAQADIFVLPSRYDGWGVVVNQAITAQLAIVTTDAVGAAEYVSEENGYIVP
ncbi:MAG: glycosyltransferase family 4 protein, partial [Verrucomicrobiota bacterium]